MRTIVFLLMSLSLFSLPALAQQERNCFELSEDGQNWPESPTLICTEKMAADGNGQPVYQVTIRPAGVEGAAPSDGGLVLDYATLTKIRCRDCHSENYTPRGQTDVLTKILGDNVTIAFHGALAAGNDMTVWNVTGEVKIFGKNFFYRGTLPR